MTPSNTSIEKHAFCIMAHDDLFCLKTLIDLLDHEQNDIFLLIDKKSEKIKEESLKTHLSNLFIIPKDRRIDIRWGGLSQVKGELTLFKYALSKGNYKYIHLLSGADLPLMPPDEIHRAFDSFPEGSNLVSFSEGEEIQKNVNFKTGVYHPFVEFQRFRKDRNPLHFFQDVGAKVLRKAAVKFQQLVGYKRDWKDIEIKKGSQWVSLSSDFAGYLVKNESLILKRFKGVICPDEIFIQTMIYNSPFKSTIYPGGNLRHIDWKRGTPYIWHEEDFKELISSKSFFARKFSSYIDKKIIERLSSHIK